MALHYSGYFAAVEVVKQYTDKQLLEQIDTLYGRDNLPENYTYEQLLNETLRQLDREFTDTNSEEYKNRELIKALYKA